VEYKEAFAYFGSYLKDALIEFFGRGTDGGIIIIGAIAIIPLGMWACGTRCGGAARTERQGTRRKRKRKEAVKSE
jgi:hypothetical protein